MPVELARVQPGERLVFFGDSHLSPEAPGPMEVVCRFLDEVGGAASRVYCLGDLFDYWLGGAHEREFERVTDALKGLVARGVRVSFLQGNRDFHVDSGFGRRTGVAVHEDGVSLDLAGLFVHCCHGDLLCARDRRYQRLRRAIRSWTGRQLFLALPLAARRRLARSLRGASRREVRAKSAATMGIVSGEVARLFRQGYGAVICGHVHVAERRGFAPGGGGGNGTRWLFTLGGWGPQGGSYLVWEQGEFRFEEYRA